MDYRTNLGHFFRNPSGRRCHFEALHRIFFKSVECLSDLNRVGLGAHTHTHTHRERERAPNATGMSEPSKGSVKHNDVDDKCITVPKAAHVPNE